MMDNIQAQLTDHSNKISQTISSTVQHEVNLLGEKLKSDIREQMADINTKINRIENNFTSEINTVKKSVDSCEVRMNKNEDDVNRVMKLNELKIKGVPYSVDENLDVIFASISNYIGYDLSKPNNIPNLMRIQNKKVDANGLIQNPTVIVKFIAKHIRDSFYSLYLAKVSGKPLMSEHIDLAQGSRVIISENLTAVNQKLFLNAMKMKIENKFAKVFTRDDLVQVKKSIDSKPKLIRSSRDLDQLVSEADAQTTAATLPQSGNVNTNAASNKHDNDEFDSNDINNNNNTNDRINTHKWSNFK